jgi:hypothetical protein
MDICFALIGSDKDSFVHFAVVHVHLVKELEIDYTMYVLIQQDNSQCQKSFTIEMDRQCIQLQKTWMILHQL